MRYSIEVTREDDAWLANVANLKGAHTYARTWAGLQASVDEVIRLVADLPDDKELDLEWDLRGAGSDFLEAVSLREERARWEEKQSSLADATFRSISRLTDRGVSVRDIGELLGISPGRVSQLSTKKAKTTLR